MKKKHLMKNTVNQIDEHGMAHLFRGDKKKMNDIKGIIEDVEKSSLVSDKVIKKVIKIIGQEEWNNIYDEESDICTTTRELIITLKSVAELEKENVEMKKQLAKAKEQIEQMKCCENCRYYSRTYGHCYSYDSYQNCKSLSNWKLAE